MQGLQWPSLIQALVLHPGGPPLLRITSIGPPCTNDRDSLREIGFRLVEFAQSVNVNLAFRGVVASRLDDIKPWLLQTKQEVDRNQAEFLDRFTEGLLYYSTMFDSLEASSAQLEKCLTKLYRKREICNIVSCEGPARTERHEPLAKWRDRLNRAGFKTLQLGPIPFGQANMMFSLFSVEGYCVEEKEGCLTLGWDG
ncbi:hypothetical protein M9H77_01886 [Catharanthus roseus]|uniref:Uncharacterized protein n=1 Tax=Catharanthus roseus TaxID=4058 RepID=A0ACC0C6U2_CATRO|nr:hypothetical protein M9H77_01886 [Catharanthus roseus]